MSKARHAEYTRATIFFLYPRKNIVPHINKKVDIKDPIAVKRAE